MRIDLASQSFLPGSLPSQSESAPRDPSLTSAPEDVQTIMIRLPEIIRQVLGTQHITSTSDEDAPVNHGLLRGVF